MLCSKFKQILLTKSTLHNNVQYRCLIKSGFISRKWVYFDGLWAAVARRDSLRSMSSLRIILKDFRLWSAWTRSNIVSTVVRRCKRDRSVREVIQCFRQAFFRPRRTLLLSATAAYKTDNDNEEPPPPPNCEQNITDVDLQVLVSELDGVESLSRSTLFCPQCGNRRLIEKKQSGVSYCLCKDVTISSDSCDGWMPYMEAEDVIIWRKEYKPGQGLYAYKVYGRYSDVRACDFAAIQVDGGYRRVWDAAVASLAVVENAANGLPDQAILHWEVLWPRLFANRDYVYIRRHKEFDATGQTQPQRDAIFTRTTSSPAAPSHAERPSVHSNAKRKAMEAYERERDGDSTDKVYVIVSRSCEHPSVPETKHAIRVTEYWSHMVVRTLHGADKFGMEFVLTYYDEPAVGGMPSSVATWATGRAAPAYLQRMRTAASQYRAWRDTQQEDLPDFPPFVTKPIANEEQEKETAPVREQDMETSKQGPEMESSEAATRDQSTQTDGDQPPRGNEDKVTQPAPSKVTADKCIATEVPPTETKKEAAPPCEMGEKADDEEPAPSNASWWRYLYPFYYFV